MNNKRYAMVLAAGRGERLRPLTDTTPKPLLMAGSCRLIEHHLHALARAGYTDVVINIGHLGQMIIDQLGGGESYHLNIHYSDEQGNVLETGGGIAKALPLLKEEQFLVINGDVWTDFDLATLPSNISNLSHLILVKNPSHNPDGDFSLVKDTVYEKMHAIESWTYSGIGIFTHRLFELSKGGRFPLAPLLRSKMPAKQVSGQIHEGQWFDIGTIERLDALNILLSQNTN